MKKSPPPPQNHFVLKKSITSSTSDEKVQEILDNDGVLVKSDITSMPDQNAGNALTPPTTTSQEKVPCVDSSPKKHRFLSLKQFFSKIRDYRPTPNVKPVYFFFGAFAVIFLIGFSLFTHLGTFDIPLYIAETGVLMRFHFGGGDLAAILLVGILFVLFSSLSFNSLQKLNPPTVRSHKLRSWLPQIYQIFTIFYLLGVVIHTIANQLDNIMELFLPLNQYVDGNSLEGQLRAGIYFYDELLGHFLLGAGFFGMFSVNVGLDLTHNDQYKATKFEGVLIFLFGLGFGASNGYAFTEGQMGLVFLIFSFIQTIFIVVMMFRNTLTFRNNPFTLCAIAACLGYTLFILFWVIFTGHKPYYPFLFQPSEL
jgi:hypothetical protein